MSVAKKKSRTSTRDVVPGFGQSVRDRRERLGLTLADVADMTGSAPSTISEVERGHRSVSLRLAYAIADALGVPLDALRTHPPTPAAGSAAQP